MNETLFSAEIGEHNFVHPERARAESLLYGSNQTKNMDVFKTYLRKTFFVITRLFSLMSVRHHFKDDQYNGSEASQTPITIHILKIYNADRSKMK